MGESYKEVLTRFIQEQEAEAAILTEQAVQYVAEEFEKDAGNVKSAVNMAMSRLEKDGNIFRISKGVYCKRIETAFGVYVPDKDKLFCRRLLRDNGNTVGYETGLSGLNRLGLVSQIPRKIYIASNFYRKRVPEDVQVEVKKPPVTVNDENCRYLQILDAINDMDKAAVDAAHPAAILKKAAEELALDTDKLIFLARKHYSNKTLIRTIDILLEGKYETA
ncbi:MAG TPA: hypothetical protein IAB13_02055 [Candidatus Avanaerovorax faecigallinarum]|nr:hypothetical protein [Candidatus Avanaerovorax faecigallinarum]